MSNRNDYESTVGNASTSIIPAVGSQMPSELLSKSDFTQAMQRYFPSVQIKGFGPITKFVGSLVQAANVHYAIRSVSSVEKERIGAIARASREHDKALAAIASMQRDVELERIAANQEAEIAKAREWGKTERMRLSLEHEQSMHLIDRHYDAEEQRIRDSGRKHKREMRSQHARDRQIEQYGKSISSMCDRLLNAALKGDRMAMSALITLETHWATVLESTSSRETFLTLANKK